MVSLRRVVCLASSVVVVVGHDDFYAVRDLMCCRRICEYFDESGTGRKRGMDSRLIYSRSPCHQTVSWADLRALVGKSTRRGLASSAQIYLIRTISLAPPSCM
jgi:hypothetical protein